MMTARADVSRREFLKISALAGGGLLISIALGEPGEVSARPSGSDPTYELNIYVAIDTAGQATLTVPRPDMGQGTRTALPMILAEELDVDWASVRVAQAPADRAYGEQSATGSTTVAGCYSQLREAGGVARAMLVGAAAQIWSVAADECRTESGSVIHEASGQQLSYADLAEVASAFNPAAFRRPALKQPADFRLIGTSVDRYDAPDIVSGRATYGLDVRVPGLLFAVVARPPVYGGGVASYDDSAARAIDGVREVVHLAAEVDRGLAVVADSTWAALQGRDALEIDWEAGPNAEVSTESIRAQLTAELESSLASLREREGDAGGAVEAAYESPYLAHAPMEPMNCSADVRADACEVWVPTQSPQDAQAAAQDRSGIRAPTVHVTLSGGGFGRRSETDFVHEAVFLSQAVGAPVQVVWTRADDLRYDRFRPISMNALRTELDEGGLPLAWRHLVVGPYIGTPRWNPLDQGTRSQGYRLGAVNVVTRMITDIPVPTGIWRAVYSNNNAFAHECFLDEVAVAGGRDPYELRRAILTDAQKLEVLDTVAEMAGWGSPMPDGWGRGIACHSTWGVTHVAQVAEVSLADNGVVRVHRVVCAVDCGLAVNPDMVRAQMEGGIVMGLTAALKGEITFAGGIAQQSNFHNYPILRMDEMPTIEVHILPSDRAPQGVGEMAVPPIAPAVANAIFAATGRRIRRLPIREDDLRGL